MKRILLTACAALLFWVAGAQESPKRWTLQECLDYALEHNIRLR